MTPKRKLLVLVSVFLLLGGTALFLYLKKNKWNTTEDNPFVHFAIEDTASITKFTIQDRNGEVAILERTDKNSWTINHQYLARRDAIDNLMNVFRKIKVKGDVPAKAKENMLSIMASSAKEVKIYGKNGEWLKTFYVGPNTQDHTGTIMILETPEDGRGNDPYITYLEEKTGFLNPFFFTSQNEWRNTNVFSYPNHTIQSIEILNYTFPNESLKLTYLGNNKLQMESWVNGQLQRVPQLDTTLAFDLLKRYEKVHLESYNTLLKPQAADSIMRTQPVFVVNVTDQSGVQTHVSLYLKRAKEMSYDAAGQLTPFDPEYFWAKTDKNEIGLAQYFVFEPLLQPLSFYSHH